MYKIATVCVSGVTAVPIDLKPIPQAAVVRQAEASNTAHRGGNDGYAKDY